MYIVSHKLVTTYKMMIKNSFSVIYITLFYIKIIFKLTFLLFKTFFVFILGLLVLVTLLSS